MLVCLNKVFPEQGQSETENLKEGWQFSPFSLGKTATLAMVCDLRVAIVLVSLGIGRGTKFISAHATVRE